MVDDVGRIDNRDVITSFVVGNRDSVYRLAYIYVHNREDALDIVQDSVYKALSATKSLDNPLSVRPWFYRIVINTALDYIRMNRRHLYVEADSLDTGAPGSGDKYQEFDLRKAIGNLSTINRTVVILRFYEGLKLDEVASIMGENLSTIKSRLYTSLQKLRFELAEPAEAPARHRDTGETVVSIDE